MLRFNQSLRSKTHDSRLSNQHGFPLQPAGDRIIEAAQSIFCYFCRQHIKMLYLFGIGINLFLILLLSSKKNKTLADNLLLAWIIIICCHLLLFVVASTDTNNNYPDVYAIAPLFPLLHGPMLYLYSAAMTNMLPESKTKWALHFLPIVVVLLIVSPFFMLSDVEKKAVIDSGGKGYELQISINNYATLISGIVYVTLLFLLLAKHKKNISNQFSNDEKIKLNWLRYLIYGLGLIWLLIIAQMLQSKTLDNYIFAVAELIVVVIGYFGIRQGRIYDRSSTQQLIVRPDIISKNTGLDFPTLDETNVIPLPEELSNPEETPTKEVIVKKKYANSGLTELAAQNLYTQLKELMQREKLYTEPELTLSALAQKLAIYPNYLSQVINEKEGKTFYDYINTLRVEEFIRLSGLAENSKFTMISLASECGFNSKSSFNKNFKKVTGQSPSEYLKKKP